LAFICGRDSAGLALRGNKLFVLFQPPRTAGKSASFWELQVSAKSGSLTNSSWPNPSTKPQSEGEWEPLIKGEEQEKVFRGIKRVLTNAPALGLPDVMKPFSLYVHE
jgi:hypothetical protein